MPFIFYTIQLVTQVAALKQVVGYRGMQLELSVFMFIPHLVLAVRKTYVFFDSVFK